MSQNQKNRFIPEFLPVFNMRVHFTDFSQERYNFLMTYRNTLFFTNLKAQKAEIYNMVT